MTQDRTNISRFVGHVTNLGVAVLGLLLVHEIAYQLAGWYDTGHHLSVPDHHHQSLLVSIVGPMALLAAVAVVVRQARRLGLTVSASIWQLSASIAAMYLVQESAEVVASGAGLGGLVANHAVPVGLLLTPVVAAVLVALLRQATELVRAWLAIEPVVVASAPLWVRAPYAPWADAAPSKPGQPRAPPFICM